MRSLALLVTLLAAAACDRGAPSGTSAASAEASAPPPPAAASASAPAAPSADRASAAASAQAAPVMADPARLALEGRAVQGGLMRAKLNGKLLRMTFPGHRVIVSDDGEFLIAFSREAKQDKLTITFDDGQVLERVFDVEQRTFETDKIDHLPDNMVKLDNATRAKLAQVDKKLDAVREKYSKKPCYKDGFVLPTKGKITSRYGQPRLLNGTDGGIHWGVDIAANVGSPVRAPACGKVVFIEKDLPLSGNTLIIDHGQGLTSTFIHLSSFGVKLNDEVKQGQLVARVGMTGRTNGAHLDWRMNLFGTRIDPELVVSGEK